MKTSSMVKKLGQNTAEYMLLLLLIGGASIVAFKYFGKGIINRFYSIVNVITGNGEEEFTTAKANGETVDFKTFDKQGSGTGSGTPPVTP